MISPLRSLVFPAFLLAAAWTRQLRLGQHIEFARRARDRLGDRLTLIEPITYRALEGWAFYDVFLDRRRWPELIRRGYDAAVEALAPFRRKRQAA